MSAGAAIILILVLVWIAALTPMILRKMAERETVVSVDRFHDSLRVLRLAHPRLVAASQQAGTYAGPIGPVSRVAMSGPAEVPRPVASKRAVPAPAPVTSQRRRRVLAYLGGALFVTVVLGSVPSLRVAWDVSLMMLALAAVYIGLLVYLHRLALERSRKVIYLHGGNELRVPAPVVAGAAGMCHVGPLRAGTPEPDPFEDTVPMEVVLV